MNYTNQANQILNQGDQVSIVDPGKIEIIIDLHKKAIEEATLVDINQLNDRLGNFGNHYRDEFIKGSELIVDGYEKRDNKIYMDGRLLLFRWGDFEREG